MVRRPNFITIVLISVLLLPLPLSARSGGGFRSSGSTTPRGGSRGGLFGGASSSAPAFKPTPAADSHGILWITLKTQNAEVYIDDRLVGLASDFNGTVIVSVPAGRHIVEFRYTGSRLRPVQLDIVPGSHTSIE